MTGFWLAEHLWLLLAAYGVYYAVVVAGLPLLGQSAFIAAGSFGTVLLADRWDWPLLLAVGAAVVVTGVFAWILAGAALRLRAAEIAVATWAAAWLADAVLRGFPDMSGGEQGLTRTAPARLVSRGLGVTVTLRPSAHIAIAIVLCALAAGAAWWLRHGPLRLDFAAIRSDPSVAASVGLPVRRLRRATVVAAAVCGALAGAGLALLRGVAAASDVAPIIGLQLLAAVLLGQALGAAGPLAGLAVVSAMPTVAGWIARAGGLDPDRTRGLITAVLLLAALGASRLFSLRIGRFGETRRDDTHADFPQSSEGVGGAVLVATGLRKSFGIVDAVRGVDIEVRAGEVHALIGGNGSGKTTTLQLLAGSQRPDAGIVVIGGRDVSPLAEWQRARAGVVRTQQHGVVLAELCGADQVAVGARCTEPPAWRAALATPSARRAAAASRARVATLLARAGLATSANLPPDELSASAQRLLPALRAVATGARVVLLDEPAAGLAPSEVAALAAVLTTLARNGVGVLLVEHNMRLVGTVADRVTVLDGGVVLASGTVTDVRADPAVRAALLGTEVLAG